MQGKSRRTSWLELRGYMGKEREKIYKVILVGSEYQAEVCGLACWAIGNLANLNEKGKSYLERVLTQPVQWDPES